LGFSRLARVEVKRERLDITRKVRSVSEELGVSDRIEVQEGMVAYGDPDLVRIVLTNLIDNACKFSCVGPMVKVGQENGAVWVRDEGVGFDMKFANKLFRPFERLVTEKQFPGTGIGLASVERIVKRHGGKVWAESKPGSGATFFFTLG
jgi:signal transduction histidine kinase